MRYPPTPLNVSWSELEPKRFEDMVSVLLSMLHPDSIRTDGSGGDGGKDVHFDSPQGLEIFELKSFTGRLTKNRLQQVARSFSRALLLSPSTWTVVCPIDLTHAERTKFEALTEGSNVTCDWRGKTWLDARMAENPCVPRYFLSDVNNEIRELAQLFEQEKAALTNGVPDALERLRRLAEQCDELDPFYRVDLATDSGVGTVSARLIPRYPGADTDRPISFQATLMFPDRDSAESTRDQFQAAYDFGEGVSVPSEYVHGVVVDAPAGLGGEFSSGELQISPRQLSDVPEFGLQLTITAPDGTHVSTLPLTGQARTIGARGLIADLWDSPHLLSAEMRVDWEEHSFHINCHFEARPCFPSAMLPTLRFMAAFNAPNSLAFRLTDGTAVGPPTQLVTDMGESFERSVTTVQTLARVQDATSTWFDVPDELSDDDLQRLVAADRLLGGQVVQGTWQRLESDTEAQWGRMLLEQFAGLSVSVDTPVSFWQKMDEVWTIAGHTLPLGWTTTVMHSARLLNPAATTEAVTRAGPTDSVHFAFVPGNVKTFLKWKGAPEDRPPIVPPSGAAEVRCILPR